MTVNVKSKLQHEKFYTFILGDDMDFYEEFVVNLSDEDQLKFLEENPKFMSSYGIDKDNILMLRDKSYGDILRKIRRYEEE